VAEEEKKPTVDESTVIVEHEVPYSRMYVAKKGAQDAETTNERDSK